MNALYYIPEVWKEVSIGKGLYDVSNFGNYRRNESYVYINHPTKPYYRKQKGHLSSLNVKGRGYLGTTLSVEGEILQPYIHQLVAESFVPNPDPEHFDQINHKNGNKFDNRPENLEWCDSRYNLMYDDRHIKVGLKERGKDVHNKKEVLVFKNGYLVGRFSSIINASKAIGVNESGIRNVIYGKSNTAKDFTFEYADGSGKWSEEKIKESKEKAKLNKRNNYKNKVK